MSNSDVRSADPKQVVFIDSRAPDIQALIAGVAPGELVFVLDASHDGVQQIADILTANNLTGLSAISIVGHGSSGEIQLGSIWFDETDLADHAAALATIGAALTADGDLALYACNTAAGAAGQQFIADLSTYTSADVAAATHVVGDAAHGGSWTLDASTGAIEASAPFTDAALASFQGELAGALDGQLWFGTAGAGSTAPFGFINSDGSNKTIYQASSGTANANISNVGLDTVNGLYFALSQDVNDDVRIISGSMTTGTKVSSLGLNPNGNTSLYTVNALAVDAKNHVVYLGIWGTNADSGIIKVSYDPQTGIVNGGNSILTATGPTGVIDPTKYVLHAGTSFTNPVQFSLDTANQKLYFAANDLYGAGGAPYPGYTATNGIYVVDLTSGSPTATLLSIQSQFPTSDPTHGIVGMAVNYAQGIIYFVTSDLDGTISTDSTFWQMPIGGGTATQMPVSGINNVPVSGLTFDPISRQLIVSNTDATGSAVYTLALDAAGTHVGSPVLLVDVNPGNADTVTGIVFNALPTIGSLSGNASQALEGGSGVALLGTTPNGVVDADSGGYLASATVTITNAKAGDIIGVDATFSFTTTPTAVNPATGGSFLVSYDSATHKLTIANASGVTNTIAQYQALLAHITFKDTGTDTTTVGHPTRTVSWQLNDGSIGNPVGTNNVTTTIITIDRAPVAAADTGAAVSGGSNASGNVISNDSDPDGDARTVTLVNGSAGGVGNPVSGTYGQLTLNSNGTYTYTANNTTAINNAANGSHPTDSFTYTVSDGNGGTAQTTLTITIDRAPTVGADVNTVVAGGSTAAVSVLANDSDRDGDTVTVTAVNGSAGGVGNPVAGTYGQLTLGSNGSYTYAANNAGAISSGTTGSHLTDTFNYTVSDGQGGTSTSTVTITLDRAPTVVADTDTALSGGAAVNGNVLTDDSDRDGDTLIVSAVTGGSVGAVIQGTYGNYQLNANGTYTYTAGVTSTQLTNIANAGGNPTEHITYMVSDGHGGLTPSSLDIDVESAPVITSITASGADIDGGGNGDINAGHVVTLTLHMSSAVTVVGGVPTLTLNDGGTATYQSTSGSDLIFTYTVLPGHNTADLAVTALVTNGATIQDGASQAADFTIVPAVTGTLQIDTTAATVASVTTSGTGITAGSGDLNAGHVVTFTVNTSEVVLVDTTGGTPTLTLSNGATATYSGGSGSSALTFTYTVAAGQDTADLAVSAANLNGGTVKDAAGNAADLGAAATNPAGTLQIDTHAPAVSSVATSGAGITAGDGDLNAGHVVTFTVTLDEAVTVAGGPPMLTLNNGGVATYSGGSGSTTLTFSYTVAAGQDTSDLAVIAANLNGGTVRDAASNNADLSAAVTNPTGTLQIDTTAPIVSSVETSGTGITNGDGLLHVGDTVTFTVHLSEAVTVSGGVPHLTLNDGGVATYSSGSGTDTLTFTYTVAAGHNTSDLAVTGSSLNSAAVVDAAGNAANLAGAATNPTGTLQVDTTAPTVSLVTTSGTDITAGSGDLNAGHVVTFTVNLSEVVTVDTSGGTPTLTLNSGGGAVATYVGGSGSSVLTFSYTVAAGQNTSDLAVTAVNLNGATVKDAATNDADLSAAVTNPAGTLQIDTTAAHVASVTTSGAGIDGSGNGILTVGNTVTFTVNMDETVFVTGGPATLVLNNGGIATYSGGSGSTALTFTYTVAAGENTTDLAVNSVNLNGATVATVQDAAFNDANLSGAVANPAGTLEINTTAPTVSSVATSGAGITAGDGDLNAGHTVTFTVTLDESVTVAGGTPTLTLNNGGVATYSGGSGTGALTFTYTVAAGQDTADLAVTAANLNGATIKDAATNDADLSAAVVNPAGTLHIDTVAPTVSSVATSGTGITAGDGLLHIGDTVTFTVSLSEAVTIVGGVPTLILSDGGVATYSGGSGTNTLTFTHTVAAGQSTGDLAVTGSSLNGATVHDAAGNAADLAGATTNPAGTLQVDGIAPTVSSVTTSGPGITAGTGLVHIGDTVTFTVTLDEAVTIAGGTPTLTLNDGGVATYSSGSGSNVLTFTYTVAAGQNTADLAVTGSNLNSATVRDAAGNDADLAGAATNPAGTLQVDGTVPTVTSVTTSGLGVDANGNGDLNAGQIVMITVNISENITVTGTPVLTLNDGGVASYISGSGTNQLVFVHTVHHGYNASDLAVTGIDLTSATVKDVAGNNADLSAAVTNPGGTLQIDTTAPTFSSVATSGAGITAGTGNLNAGDVVTFTVNASEVVFVTGTPTLTLNDGGTATYTGGSGTGALTFSYTVLAGQNTSDLTVTAANLNGGSIQDGAGNATDLISAATNPAGTLKIDTTAPTVSVSSSLTTLHAGDTAIVTFTFSEAVTDFTLGDVLATGGSLSGLTQVGTSNVYTATFTPVATNTEVGQVQVNVSSYTDLAGNAGAASNAINYTGDTLKPHGTAVANPGSGVLMYGQTTHITLSFTEAVTFSGGLPVLTLNDGGTATFNAAATLALGNPTKMVFDYTVGANDSSVSTLAITGVSGGSITDLAGNASDSLATSFNGLSVQTSVITAHNDSSNVKAGYTVSADAAHGVLVNDTDTNPLDHLVVSAVNGSAGGVGHVVNGTYGSLTLHADGSYSYTANGTSNGYQVDTFSYTANNGHGQSSTSTLSVGVYGNSFTYYSVPSGGAGGGYYGNVVLDGSAGNATLNSTNNLQGVQFLIGGPGDVLNGATYGSETFVFNGNFGHNTVNNFQTSQDFIQLQQSQVGGIANVLADLHQVGANAVLTLDADHVITITNMQVASLTAANFHLV